MGPGQGLRVGDHCFVRKPPDPQRARRLQDKNFEDIFQIVETHGEGIDAKAYTVSDLLGNREGLGFSQPVSADRLVPIEMLPIVQSKDTDRPLRISINDRGRERTARVQNQCIDGRVSIRFDDETIDRWVDLSTLQYSWLSPTALH